MNAQLIKSADERTSGLLVMNASGARRPLLVCIHGGGCNAHYFNLKGRSVLDTALARGFPVLLLNRPGYGSNPPVQGARPVLGGVNIIGSFIDQVMATYALREDGFVIIGHSIGGATALELAAARWGKWPLRGIAISGVGDESPPGIQSWDPEQFRARSKPDHAATSLYLGPEGTYSWQALTAFRRAGDEWRLEEAVEMIHQWPLRWRQIASRISVPVHLRLAEHEKIWVTGETVVARMAAALANSPMVDAGLLHEGGHLYELHKRGPELTHSQLNFLESCLGSRLANYPISLE